MATSAHSFRGGIAAEVDKVRATPGFDVEDVGDGFKVTNTETGASKKLHKGSPEYAIPKVLSDLRRIVGWSPELYEEFQAAERSARRAEAKRVEHRTNTFIASLEAPLGGGAKTEDTQPSENETRGKGIATVIDVARPAVFGIGDVARWKVGDVVFTISLEAITAEKADEYLGMIGDINPEDGLKAQRKSSKGHIADFMWKFRRKEFGLSPDMIVFNRYGQMVNGQHRLRAATTELHEGQSALFLVTREWPADVIYRVDHNKVRSTGDALYMRHEKDPNNLAVVLRLLWMYDNQKQKDWGSIKVSDPMALEVLDANPGVRESRTWGNRSKGLGCSRPALWLSHYLISRASLADGQPVYQQEIDGWFERLVEGYELGRQEPVAKLNKWFMGKETRRATEAISKAPPRILHLYVILKQWNNTQLGKTFKPNASLSPKVPFNVPEVMGYVPEAQRVGGVADDD